MFEDIELLVSKIDKIPSDMDIKEKAKEVKKEILALEVKLGLEFKLRK